MQTREISLGLDAKLIEYFLDPEDQPEELASLDVGNTWSTRRNPRMVG